MTHGSLFSGEGGFDLASEWMGWENKFHCEINPFGRTILNYYWPNAKSYEDIKTTDFSIWRGLIDVLSGGFPCQPYSTAGKRLGKEDDRHLWPEMLRAIREISPRWVVGENVRGLTNWNGGVVFDEVQADLEAENYEVLPFLLPACAVNAPHRRDRIFFVARRAMENSGSIGRVGQTVLCEQQRGVSVFGPSEDRDSGIGEELESTVANTINRGSQNRRIKSDSILSRECGEWDSNSDQFSKAKKCGKVRTTTDTNSSGHKGRTIKAPWQIAANRSNWSQFPTQSPVCSGDDGIPGMVDSDTVFRMLCVEHPRQPAIGFGKWRNESIKAHGNAVVPQVVYEIFKVIQLIEDKNI